MNYEEFGNEFWDWNIIDRIDFQANANGMVCMLRNRTLQEEV
jgi:hypothetical protein